VLVYLGDLTPVFRALRGALRDGGRFAFSVEAGDGEEPVLRASSRYAHSDGYLRKMAADFGFDIESLDAQVLRYDDGAPIDGYLVLMRCRK
jgi:predicted TPR repeat methyltransferase